MYFLNKIEELVSFAKPEKDQFFTTLSYETLGHLLKILNVASSSLSKERSEEDGRTKEDFLKKVAFIVRSSISLVRLFMKSLSSWGDLRGKDLPYNELTCR
jgi:hypothetical protein